MIRAGLSPAAPCPSYVQVAHTSHLEPLHGLSDAGRRALSALEAAWWVTHDEMSRDRFMTLVAEAQAVSS